MVEYLSWFGSVESPQSHHRRYLLFSGLPYKKGFTETRFSEPLASICQSDWSTVFCQPFFSKILFLGMFQRTWFESCFFG
ncbi:hypothetical protein P872_10625 [Rhodonellum psychrophilum GCM71 = DSM 17998]|uniref:Uncharacterized protein n=1 Tax=Rhodonellum psychrophilum GCM71 = DSM 17998 TaxID=1123057 RepID=U5BLJ0_9BACT|nr:hypothetical protein P872_10625 [Rhodonellum psychrophilum GCM71 = DSM 17998]